MIERPSMTPGSRIIPVLREGVCVIQMILFKELRALLCVKYPQRPSHELAMLTGAITNEIFGTRNNEKDYLDFHQQHQADIEQELLALAGELPTLRGPLSDALRVLTLCDSMEGKENPRLLTLAAELRILIPDRDIPLPSTFMTMVRNLGDAHQLISAPREITPAASGGEIH